MQGCADFSLLVAELCRTRWVSLQRSPDSLAGFKGYMKGTAKHRRIRGVRGTRKETELWEERIKERGKKDEG